MPARIHGARRRLIGRPIIGLVAAVTVVLAGCGSFLGREAVQVNFVDRARPVSILNVRADATRYLSDPSGGHPLYKQTVWYGPANNQSYDVYWPAFGRRRAGAVFLLHPGMWFGGSKAEVTSYATRLARQGWVAAAVDFAGFPAPHAWPAAVNDVFSALDSFRSRSGVYGFNPGRVVAVGFSSGGHLAQLLATVGRGRDRLAAVATFSGISDPAGLFRYPVSGGCLAYPACEPAGLAKVFSDVASGATPVNNPGLYADAAPIDHVTAGDAPMLLVGSTAEIIPASQITQLVLADRAAGVPVSAVQVPGARHAQELMPVAILALLRWLNAYAG